MKNEDNIGGTPGVFILSECPRTLEVPQQPQEQNDKNIDFKKSAEKHTWTNSTEFLMSCIAYSVGFGNVWRFPHTAYSNGGGVFVIVYLIVLFIVGKPLYYMESVIGQFSSRSAVKMWSFCPAFEGIGYGITIAVFLVQSYYTLLMAIVLYYLVLSFQSPLPWSICQSEWGYDCFNSSKTDNLNMSIININRTANHAKSSSELFFFKVVLKESRITNGLGVPSWQLVLCLFISWIFIFLVLFKGIKSSGKASYFLAIFPYFMMLTLFVKAFTLDGAINGIVYFLQPEWSKMTDPNVWYAAVTQAFFSLGVCFGGVVMYASYNKFEHKVTRDCMIVSTLDLCTSLIAGSTIFGILGNLAYELGKEDDFHSVVRSGTGLAFISYPEALAKFSVVPSLFSISFFLMLFVLGIGCSAAFCNVMNATLKEHFPIIDWKISFTVCLLGFIAGLIYCTPGGQYMVNLIDYYAGTVLPITFATIEIIGISWIYGVDNFLDDMEFMIKRRPSLFWRTCWALLTPVTLCIIFLYFIATIKPIMYNNEYYPFTAYVAGWTLVAIGILPFFTILITKAYRNKNNIIKIFEPTEDWGPVDEELHKEWKIFKDLQKYKRSVAMKKNFKSKLCSLLFDKN